MASWLAAVFALPIAHIAELRPWCQLNLWLAGSVRGPTALSRPILLRIDASVTKSGTAQNVNWLPCMLLLIEGHHRLMENWHRTSVGDQRYRVVGRFGMHHQPGARPIF